MGLARTGEKDQRAVDIRQEMGFAGILFNSVPTQPVQFQPRKRITLDSGNGKGNVFSFRKLEKRRKSQEIGKLGYQQA